MSGLPEVFQDPYPYYAVLRENAPVHKSDLWGGWCLARWSEVVAALKDSRMSARRADGFVELVPEEHRAEFLPVADLSASGMGFSDPPEHARLRGLVATAFSYRSVADLRRDVQVVADDLLDELSLHDGSADLIAGYAYPLPATVIMKVIGVSTEDMDRIKQWSDDMTTLLAYGKPTPESIARTKQATFALVEYFRSLIHARRRDPRDDLVSALVSVCDGDPAYSESDIIAVLVPLMAAGHETTTNLIGNGMLALLRHPMQLKVLRDNPSCLGSAVEELLRFDSPVQRTTRVATEDMQIDGQRIARGDLVICLLGSANRDPMQFDDPEKLDIRREARHLAFSHGIHTCVGASLARLEAQVAIGTLLKRFPGLALVYDNVEFAENFAFRGLIKLPIDLSTKEQEAAKVP